MSATTTADCPEPVPRGVVPVTYVRLLFEYLDQLGHNAPSVLSEAPPDIDDRGIGRYPVARWCSLLDRAARHLHDPLLGLHLGQTITPAHFGVMGYVFLACSTLGAALQRLFRYQRLIYDVSPMHYRVDGASVVLEWGTEAGRPGPLADETAITALVQLARDMTGRRLVPDRIAFVNPPPPDPGPYAAYYGCPVAFAQARTAVRFPISALQWPLRRPDPTLLALLEQQAAALLAELPSADDFEQSVRRCIARLARDGEPTLDRVATALHLSPRTLHRRLEARDSGFRALRDDTLRHLAEDYLRDPRLQLSEIAQLLGYSEQSAFSRAFRRWTGSSPQRQRKALA